MVILQYPRQPQVGDLELCFLFSQQDQACSCNAAVDQVRRAVDWDRSLHCPQAGVQARLRMRVPSRTHLLLAEAAAAQIELRLADMSLQEWSFVQYTYFTVVGRVGRVLKLVKLFKFQDMIGTFSLKAWANHN